MKINGPILAAVLFGVLLIGWGLYTTRSDKTPSTVIETPRTDTDTDADGIPDWEELILGLDPRNADSDGDGIPDNESLARARALLRGESQSTEEGSASLESLTRTDILARELIGAYIQAKQFGGYDPALFEEIVAVSAENQLAITVTTHSGESLRIVEPSAEIADIYVRDVRRSLEPLTEIPEYELETYGRAVTTQNSKDYEALARNASIYTQAVSALVAISVPRDAVETHLLLVNGLSAFAHALILLSESTEDPAEAFSAIKLLLESEEQVRAAFAGVSVYQVVHTEL